MTGQFGDTTLTKVFVGGLAWETQKETMSNYFEQFGEILEAVVITDKNTGRSKGYGFVTFREPEGAMRACVDPSPVIDGRRANCNLAYLGVHKSRPASPKTGSGKSFRSTKPFHNVGLHGGMASAFTPPGSYPHYAIQQGIPYGVYGYPEYSPDYTYPTGYYNFYGGAAQYPIYGGATGVVATGSSAFYPFFHQLSHGGGAGAANPPYAQSQGYGRHYSGIYPYSTPMTAAAAVATGFAPQPHGGPISFATPTPVSPSPPAAAGVRRALPLQLS